MKRQRVGIACDKCRDLKAKCDGRQPICSRCEGYGFSCTWTKRRRRGSQIAATNTNGAPPHLSPRLGSNGTAGGGLTGFARAVDSYEALLQQLRSGLDSAHQAALDASLGEIRRHVPHKEQSASRTSIEASPENNDTGAVSSPPTYVGKASDIHFIQSIRQCVQGPADPSAEAAQSYSQTHSPESLTLFKYPLLFPSPAEAEQFLDVFLSTIHIAYPFICNCWNILGFAIRMGQSIGLHVESAPNSAERAHWRRTWYAMYVLDRLLALQLGRPMAIHEFDFQVELPGANDQAPFLPSGGPDIPGPVAQDHMMDYFVEVIRFSHIVGQVIRLLYRPSQIDLSPDQILHSASNLDQRLLEWKTSLPRHLRFDLGHTFEKSMSFKRQVRVGFFK
ncbi:hypothetical protein N7456_004614 [Penicillium angulare]|uniref:Zn(2)-C6 fungal-type domain-containing protein n=1 Tax=Penicillium angulare TaxID=116970 RepID=A0A9W9KIJ4_9EURO|nr:hypothetical protein N7456_004614 [Penicillium angulare]